MHHPPYGVPPPPSHYAPPGHAYGFLLAVLRTRIAVVPIRAEFDLLHELEDMIHMGAQTITAGILLQAALEQARIISTRLFGLGFI